MTAFPAIDRLRRAAREFGCSIEVGADAAETCEGLFIADLATAVQAKADGCAHGADVVGILLRQVMVYPADVDRLIALIDDDDGWPACRLLNAVKGLCCALEFRDRNSRWLAEAALQIGELHCGDGPNGLRGDAKTWAGAALTAAVGRVGAGAGRRACVS